MITVCRICTIVGVPNGMVTTTMHTMETIREAVKVDMVAEDQTTTQTSKCQIIIKEYVNGLVCSNRMVARPNCQYKNIPLYTKSSNFSVVYTEKTPTLTLLLQIDVNSTYAQFCCPSIFLI